MDQGKHLVVILHLLEMVVLDTVEVEEQVVKDLVLLVEEAVVVNPMMVMVIEEEQEAVVVVHLVALMLVGVLVDYL